MSIQLIIYDKVSLLNVYIRLLAVLICSRTKLLHKCSWVKNDRGQYSKLSKSFLIHYIDIEVNIT